MARPGESSKPQLLIIAPRSHNYPQIYFQSTFLSLSNELVERTCKLLFSQSSSLTFYCVEISFITGVHFISLPPSLDGKQNENMASKREYMRGMPDSRQERLNISCKIYWSSFNSLPGVARLKLRFRLAKSSGKTFIEEIITAQQLSAILVCPISPSPVLGIL